MTMPVLVTGGTGRLGTPVARRLREAGCDDVRVLTRHRREAAGGIRFLTGDLATGEGVEAAVEGVAVILHCATSTDRLGGRAESAGVVKPTAIP